MFLKLKNKLRDILKWSEKWTGTDMIYLARGSFWLNSNFLISSVFALLLSITFARLLPKSIYGTYQFILSIASIITALSLTGMNNAVTQAVAKGYEGSFIKSIKTQLKWGLIPSIVAITVSIYYFLNNNSELSIAIFIVAIFQPILNTYNTYNAFLFGKKDFRHVFYFGQIFNFIYYSAMILSVFIFKNPISLILINLSAGTIINIFLHYYTIHLFKPNSNENEEILNFGKHMSASNVMGIITSQIDNIFIYHYLGAIQLAIYSFASNIPERLTSIIRNISSIALPKFSERTSTELKEKIVTKSFKLALFTLAISIIYIIIAQPLFRIFFPQYTIAVLYSQGYALVVVLASLSRLPLTTLMATNSKKEMYIYNTVFSGASLCLMLLAIIFWGIWGLIIARGISNIFSFLLLIFFVKRKE
jgi:O-antigen/teichoic acid export membrane protein